MANRVLISGSLAGHPVGYGGNTWAFLQYVLGFRRLGFTAYYVEELARGSSIDTEGKQTSFLASANAQYFRDVVDRFALHDHASLLERDGPAHVGLSRHEVECLAPDIDLFVNQFGGLRWLLPKARRRMYLDLDPGYTQIWHEQYAVDMGLSDHDVYVTVGLNLGEPDCPLPTAGIRWEKTLPPVVLDEWAATPSAGAAYSTVARWRGFADIAWAGQWYKQKSSGFDAVLDLPRHVGVPLELCLDIHPADADAAMLRERGWRIVSPKLRAGSADSYRGYLHASRAELAPAKHLYTAGRTGWFSDRTACYLASGRPVVVADTGLARHLPTGDGLMTFTDLDGAVAAIQRVERDYERHAEGARQFARKHLDSDQVLARLLTLAGM